MPDNSTFDRSDDDTRPMNQLLEFINNHLLLSGLFASLLLALLVTELMRLGSKFKPVSSAEAIRLINRENAVVLDVSASNDHQRAHIVDAINITPGQVRVDHPQLQKLKNRPLLIYCKTGQASYQVAGKLAAAWPQPVYLLRGGLAQWRQDQHPVETA
ncbi:MAG: rhodanese-like domain-containing protein [Wenzhouxiangellaceae bacterium]